MEWEVEKKLKKQFEDNFKALNSCFKANQRGIKRPS